MDHLQADILMVLVARYALILAAILAVPFYAAWVGLGALADRAGQRKH